MNALIGTLAKAIVAVAVSGGGAPIKKAAAAAVAAVKSPIKMVAATAVAADPFSEMEKGHTMEWWVLIADR